MVVSFHSLAERELNDAAAYYDLERAGLGRAFLAEAERCTLLIVEHPEAAPVVRGAIRRRLLRRFPSTLLYRVRGDEIRRTCGVAGGAAQLAPAGWFLVGVATETATVAGLRTALFAWRISGALSRGAGLR